MNVPIEVITKPKSRVTHDSYYEYNDKSAGKEGVLKTVYNLELAHPLTTFSPTGQRFLEYKQTVRSLLKRVKDLKKK